jgi:hypothetical protein
MVGPERSKAGVRSHTQISPPAADVIIDSRRSRTGSPRALNIRDRSSACSAPRALSVSGAQQASETSVSGNTCFDIPLG